MKLRAVHEVRKLKEVAADLLKRGLADQTPLEKREPVKPKIEIQAGGLPVVRCMANAPVQGMTDDDLLALERDSLAREDLQRTGHAL